MDGWFASHLNQGRKPMQALIIHAYAAPTLNLAFTANPPAEGIVGTSIHLARRTTIFRGQNMIARYANILKHLAIASLIIIIGSVSQARAASFHFSFSNVTGPVSSTVEGLITLPDGDGSFAASQVDILAYPAALGLGPAPINAMAGGTAGNGFTVSGGQITSSVFIGLINSVTALGLSSSFSGSASGVYTF